MQKMRYFDVIHAKTLNCENAFPLYSSCWHLFETSFTKISCRIENPYVRKFLYDAERHLGSQ